MRAGQASLAGHAPAYQALQWQRLLWLALWAGVIVLSLLADFTLGPAALSLGELWQALWQQGDATNQIIVWDIRLPYALMAVLVGMALGLAGAETQTVLHNPLASPFTLGLDQAAALGASLAIVLQASLPGVSGPWMVSANAFVFAMGSALLLDAVARRARLSGNGVVLLGIAMLFSFNALVSLLQFVASPEALQSMVFWTMGSLSRANWPVLGLVATALLLVLPLSLRSAWRLTALRLGEDRAQSFGIDVRRLRLASLLRVSLLTGLAVAFAGTIGFIGLIAPHIARRLFGEDHRFYLPASMLIGGAVLSWASLASKNLLPGIIIPVGVVTALVGIPFFVSVVFRHGERA